MNLRPAIWFCGDPHGQIEHVVRAIERYGAPDAVILLGDLEPPAPLHEWLAPVAEKTLVRYIHGNHDTDHVDTWKRMVDSPASAWNLDGRVEVVAGVRIAGLGGIFRQRVWYPPAEATWYSYANWEASLAPHWMPGDERSRKAGLFASQRLTHSSTIFPQAIDALAALEADVLVSHEAPSGHRHGFAVIDDLAAALGVQRLFHGHHHQRVRYPATERLEAFGVGLREVVGLEGELVFAEK